MSDYHDMGDDVWKKFKSGKDNQLWWYESCLAVTSKRSPELVLNKQLSALVAELRALLHTDHKK
jgi:hypothetical protein